MFQHALSAEIMLSQSTCSECNNPLTDSLTCQEHFHQLLFWENEVPEYGEVHHLTVLCYHLQHPSLYSPEGLAYARKLLADFLVHGLSPADVRRQNKDQVDSGKRQLKITSRPGLLGALPGSGSLDDDRRRCGCSREREFSNLCTRLGGEYLACPGRIASPLGNAVGNFLFSP